MSRHAAEIHTAYKTHCMQLSTKQSQKMNYICYTLSLLTLILIVFLQRNETWIVQISFFIAKCLLLEFIIRKAILCISDVSYLDNELK